MTTNPPIVYWGAHYPVTTCCHLASNAPYQARIEYSSCQTAIFCDNQKQHIVPLSRNLRFLKSITFLKTHIDSGWDRCASANLYCKYKQMIQANTVSNSIQISTNVTLVPIKFMKLFRFQRGPDYHSQSDLQMSGRLSILSCLQAIVSDRPEVTV